MGKNTIGLVTGASSGLGAEFCRQLSERCRKLILVGRRQPELQAVAAELEAAGVETRLLIEDLTTRIGLTRVVETIRQQGPVTMLVNNAGFGTLGAFADQRLDSQQAMVDLHISATLALTRAVIPFMRDAGGGRIINVSSLGAFFPRRDIAVYAASKAFLNTFSEALAQEVTDDGIRIQCLCPGYTHTDFHDREDFAGFDKASVPASMWMSAAEVVAESLAMLEGEGRVVFVAGEHNRALLA